jgi:hypothetical protein
VSNEDYIHLVSTYWFRADENFNCYSCKKKSSLGVRDKRMACFTPKDTPIVDYKGLIRYFVCPSNYYNPAYSQLIDMFRHFQRGVLPFSGGLLDQPTRIIEFFKLIESLDNERNEDLQRKQKWQTGQSKSNSRSTSKKR